MDPQELRAQASGFQAATVILVANHLRMLAALCGEPLSIDQLAGSLDLEVRATAMLCDALVCLGVIARTDDGRLRVADELRDALDPSSHGSLTRILDHQFHLLQRWAKLDQVLRTGEPIPRPPDDEERRRAFILGMADLARQAAPPLWAAIDLGGHRHLVDVGGGPGEYALAALERFPELRATVFDRPEVLAIAQEYAARREVGGRLATTPGDALEDDIPTCDVALVSALVHSYGPTEVDHIARHVAAGVLPGGRVLIREFLWDDDAHSGPLSAALFAVNMLGGTATGRVWSAGELEEIFGAAGFSDWSLVRIDPRSSVLAGVRD